MAFRAASMVRARRTSSDRHSAELRPVANTVHTGWPARIRVPGLGTSWMSAAASSFAASHSRVSRTETSRRANTIAFPVERGVLYRGREELGDYRWELEVYCGESPQLDYRNWPDDRAETADDLLAGASPLLSAQRLPLRVQSPLPPNNQFSSGPSRDSDHTEQPTRGPSAATLG